MSAKSTNWMICMLMILSLLLSSGWMASPRLNATAAPGSTCADITQIPPGECQALQDLYDSTNGPGWTNHYNWFVTTTPCWDWSGVSCAAGTNVTGLSLYSNHLSGTLPTSLGNLTALQSLDLAGNQITGTLPTELGNLVALNWLYLYNNQLSGSLPPELGNLTNLTRLELWNNLLSGSIPGELGNLTNLTYLALSSNQLSGSLPAELGNLDQLQELHLAWNQLTGGIPAWLENLTSLRTLELERNPLGGSIPPELGNLTALQNLYLGFNELTGPIPAQLGNLTNLQSLVLYYNQLNGVIPTELGNLSSLQTLHLTWNQLSGGIPASLGSLANLSSLNLGNNQLDGNIPASLGNLDNLNTLNLCVNHLNGELPPDLGGLANLQSLYIDGNQLSGAIPDWLGSLSQLMNLRVTNNQFSGEIPAALSNLSQISYLDLGYNMLWAQEPTLLAWLAIEDPDWYQTQTVPPEDLQATTMSSEAVQLAWTPVDYTGDSGYYQVSYTTTPGGPYTIHGVTSDKSASSYLADQLQPETIYYFIVRTYTAPHDEQQNSLLSDPTPEVSAETLPTGQDVLVDRATGIDQLACGTGANLPCYSITYALGFVAAPGDRVRVYPGTYPETISLRPDIDVISQSGPDVTIIDGAGLTGPMVSASGASITRSTRLEGFTVTGGNPLGISIYNASPVISDCIVLDNHGSYGGGIAINQAGADVLIINSQVVSNTASGDAGGIWAVNGAKLELVNSDVLSNTAGLWAGGVLAYPATLLISDSLFQDNSGTYGAGLLAAQNSVVTVTYSQFYSNTASGGGGGISVSDSVFDIRYSTIEHNQAYSGPGGVSISDGSQGYFIENIVRYNHATNHWGGGIGLGGNSHAVIRDNWISFNSVQDTVGGGIEVGDTSTFEIVGNLISGNTAGGSAGIGVSGGSGLIEGNVIRDNIVTSGGNGGINVDNNAQVEIRNNWITGNTTPGLRAWSATAQIENNLISGSQAQIDQVLIGGTGAIEVTNNTIVGYNAGTGIQINADDLYTVTNNIISDNSVGIAVVGLGNPTISYNLLWNNSGGNYQGIPPGTGDIYADPDYVDPYTNDYHLDICSSAVDIGDNLSAPAQDFDGDPRPIDGDGNGSVIVDIGADERSSVAAPMPQPGFTFTVNGLTVSFQNTSQDAVAYLWDFGDGNTSTQEDPVHTYVLPGTYTMLLTAFNTNGCSNTHQDDVTTQVAGDITPPAAITDLIETPGRAPLSVELFWTAPGDDGASGGPAAQYDIRFSEYPITEANWAGATKVVYPFPPAAPGTSQRHAVAGLTLGKRWYFAIKSADEAGNWSAISNVPSVQEMGFRPFYDGYRLPNYGGVNYSDYTLEDMRRMFGDGAVCYMSGSFCTPKPEAVWWNFMVNWYMNGGHGDGMASTSLRFFKDLDDPGELKPGANTIQELGLADARRHIAYYQVEQYADPVAGTRWQSAQGTPVDVLAELRTLLGASLTNPPLLFIQQGGTGHSLVPYAIEEKANGHVWVWVYDSNYPGTFPNDTSRTLIINPAADTWSYNLGWETWSGGASTHSLGVVPIAPYAQPPVAPWMQVPARDAANPDSVQLWLTGAGHLLATDSQGRRVGYASGQYVSEIPGASLNVSAGGLGLALEPIYSIPVTSTHTIVMEGTSLTQTEFISVTQFGSGYVVGIQNVPLAPSNLESASAAGSLFIPGDGTEVAYTAFSAQEVDLLLTKENVDQSYQFTISGADVNGIDKVVLLLDETNRRMGYITGDASSGEYDLEIKWFRPEGVARFYHANIPITARDRHYVDYTGDGGFLEIMLEIDHGGDGTIDETVKLLNQAWQIQLPVVLNYQQTP